MVTKICILNYVGDIYHRAKFYLNRLRGFWVAGGQISPSPIDFHRRPYNTLALPCERVMCRNEFLRILTNLKMVKFVNFKTNSHDCQFICGDELYTCNPVHGCMCRHTNGGPSSEWRRCWHDVRRGLRAAVHLPRPRQTVSAVRRGPHPQVSAQQRHATAFRSRT